MRDMIMNKLRIEVDADYYIALERDAIKLQCLMDCGVDNWDGYEAAMDAYRGEVVEDEVIKE